MTRSVVAFLTSVSALSLSPHARADQPPPGELTPVKVHQDMAQQHVGVVPLLERANFPALAAPAYGAPLPPPLKSFNKVAYGYLPYWSSVEDVPWEHLTHLSYFSVEMKPDGSLGNNHGWSSKGAALVSLGHSHGVKVTLTTTLFNNTEIGNLLGSASARQNAINNLLAMVQAQGGDGVNIDFEFVPKSAKANFVTFIKDLTAAFHAAIPGSHVSLATPAIDWNGSYDYDLLAENSDGMMIMGYGYHWQNGNPGPLSPISAGTTWSSRSLSWTIADYKQWGKEENRHKFVLGLPLYGRNWQTTSLTVPGTRVDGTTGGSKILSSCDTFFAQQGKLWDTDSQSPYQVYTDNGQPRQVFCEDRESMRAKFDLIVSEDLGGVMYWALGYIPPTHGVWQDADERFVDDATPVNQPPVAHITAPTTATVGEQLVLDGTGSTDPNGDALTYKWSVLAGPAVTLVNHHQAVAHLYPTQADTYLFELEVSDGSFVATAEAEVTVTSSPTGGAGAGGAGASGGDSGTGGSGGTGAGGTGAGGTGAGGTGAGGTGAGGTGAGGTGAGGTGAGGAGGDGASAGGKGPVKHIVVGGDDEETPLPAAGGCHGAGGSPQWLVLVGVLLLGLPRRRRATL